MYAQTAGHTPLAKEDMDRYITAAANSEGVSEGLIRAFMGAEGSYKYSDAVSSTGARGPMQLTSRAAIGANVTNRFDPAENFRGGAHLIAKNLADNKGDVRLAAAAYMVGQDVVNKAGGDFSKMVDNSPMHYTPAQIEAHSNAVLRKFQASLGTTASVAGPSRQMPFAPPSRRGAVGPGGPPVGAGPKMQVPKGRLSSDIEDRRGRKSPINDWFRQQGLDFMLNMREGWGDIMEDWRAEPPRMNKYGMPYGTRIK